jgi:glycosyltransferase involved in cell wall biosynthesis
MKILIISNAVTGGGAEHSMRLLNQELISQGIDSMLLCLNNSANDNPLHGEVILTRAWKAGLIGTISNFLSCVKTLKDQDPSTVVANCELAELYVALTPARIRNLISVEHTSAPWAGRRFMGLAVRLLLSFRQTTWVTVNRAQDGIWPYGNDSTFIPNPVRTPILADSGISKAPFVFVGRLRVEKGIERILEAISSVQSSIEVFGSGNLEVILKKKFETISKFHGFVANPWRRIHRNQTLVVASEYEGDGIVIVEAILAGLPILLLDNRDLRRFGLSEVNYFKSQSDLEMKLKQSMADCEKFRVSPEKIAEYKSDRDLTSVTEDWLNILR